MGMNFFDLIRKVGIFIICAQAIVHFRPDDSYEKYLRMLVSIIVLVMILLPVLKLFGAEEITILPNQYENILDIKIEEINSGFNNAKLDKPDDMGETDETDGTSEVGEARGIGAAGEDGTGQIETVEIHPVEVKQ